MLNYKHIYDNDYILCNKTLKEISKEYKISPNTLSKNFKKLGLKIRVSKRNYDNINKTAFDEWSVEMAYWLGFLAADGCIIKNSLVINLKGSDKEHLLNFKSFMNLPDECLIEKKTYNKKYDKYHNNISVLFTSEYVVNRLNKLGIVSSKTSKNIDFLLYVPKEYKLPFIFGYFDGDGCVSIDINKRRKLINFVGNEKTMKSIKNYIIKELKFNNIKCCNEKGKLYTITWSSYKDVIRFSELYIHMLKDNFFLKRKMGIFEDNLPKLKELYKMYICSKLKGYKNEVIEKETLEELLLTKSFKEIGKLYNVTGNSIVKWCKKYGLPYRVKDIEKIYNISKNGNYREPSLEKQKEIYSRTKSGLKNVGVDGSRKKPFSVRMTVGGKYKTLGYFVTREEAAQVADEKMVELFGEDVLTNKKLGLINY